MASQFWQATLPPYWSGAGSPLASSSSLTDVNATPNITLPANYLQAGMKLRFTAFGSFANTATPTLLLGIYYGAIAGTALAASTAITTTTGATNWPWRIELETTIRTIGSSGSAISQGKLYLPTSLTAWTLRPIGEVALATVAVDTTAAKALTVGAQWGAPSASNTLTCHEFRVEVLN